MGAAVNAVVTVRSGVALPVLIDESLIHTPTLQFRFELSSDLDWAELEVRGLLAAFHEGRRPECAARAKVITEYLHGDRLSGERTIRYLLNVMDQENERLLRQSALAYELDQLDLDEETKRVLMLEEVS